MDSRKFWRLAVLPVIAAGALISATTVNASTLVAFGITYELTATGLNTSTAHFTLDISGINGAADTELGRYGVESFAFNKPANFSTATPPAGFALVIGGLDSGGCKAGAANFFCFDGPTPASSVLAANSTLSYEFDVTLTSGNFLTYDPDFKINWVGTKLNYDLVSLAYENPPVENPIPGAVWLFGTVIAGGAGFGRWRKKRKAQLAVAA